MKQIAILILVLLSSVSYSCNSINGQQHNEKLSATAFADKVVRTPQATVLDVRTPGEFAGGHIENALNVDYNSESFNDYISLLDKSAPVFVYCLSGGRSQIAAKKMREAGFEQVFEMPGGMMEWRSKKLPEVSSIQATEGGMSMTDYLALLQSNELILVDFYAEWCIPCKKMEPYLNRISDEMRDQITIIRINVDENRELTTALEITGLPVLMLYKNQNKIWEHKGYLDEENIRKQLL